MKHGGPSSGSNPGGPSSGSNPGGSPSGAGSVDDAMDDEVEIEEVEGKGEGKGGEGKEGEGKAEGKGTAKSKAMPKEGKPANPRKRILSKVPPKSWSEDGRREIIV